MARHRWADEIIYYAENGQIERRQFCATTCKWGEWHLTDRPSFHESTSDFRIPQKPKLYQTRLEIPRPLTVEEALELEVVYFPYFGSAAVASSSHTFNKEMIERYAKHGLAYRTAEDATKRSEVALQTEEE